MMSCECAMRQSARGGEVSLDPRPALPAVDGNALTVNCFDQVRVWISSDGLPDKLRARLARLRAMNSDIQIVLFVSERILNPIAAGHLQEFARQIEMKVCDLETLVPADADERIILEHIHAEIEAHFFRPAAATGNLSVVSDYARLLSSVIDRGLCTDLDVEFTEPFQPGAASLPCPAGIIARFKDNGCLSNDVTAGVASSQPFRIARRNVASLVNTYREAACRYLSGVYGAELDPSTVSDHPAFFELRNLQRDGNLSGTARFSLTGGPDNLAISAHKVGLFCGYERGVVRGTESGELTADHVPHELVSTSGRGHLHYEPFEFGAPPSASARDRHRAALWPDSLPGVISHWDHSWIADHDWHHLTFRESLLLKMLQDGEWSPEAGRSVVAHRSLPPCLVRLSSREDGVQCSPRSQVLQRLTHREAPARPALLRASEAGPASHDPGSPDMARFLDDGIVAVDGLVDERALLGLRECFDAEVLSKSATTSLQQLSFNLAVDNCDRATLDRIYELACLPELTKLLDQYFGGPSRFVSARGYRQGPCKPLRYRAWDYHQDMKTAGPFEELKVMLLLTDVAPDGQAMRYVCGSQRMNWTFRTQRDTKFSLDEALHFASGGLFLAYGHAGTCVVFDTNGIHSGHRNLSATRDVLTLNFARDSSAVFYMFSDPSLVREASRDWKAVPSSRSLKLRSGAVNAEHLAAIRADYETTPDLAAVRTRWTGDAIELVDIMAADINVDLDLRLSAKFELDRERDIALVKIRDAGRDDEQYVEVVARLDRAPSGGQCLWLRSDPLVGAREAAERARSTLLSQVDGEAAANCGALLTDLCESLMRCDGVQRLRTTAAYLYFACAWAHRLLAASGGVGFPEICQQVLDLYAHVVTEDDIVATGSGNKAD